MQNRGYSRNLELINIASAVVAEFTFANATSIVTSASHGLRTGDVVRVSNSGGALPDGLLSTTDYFVLVIDANTFYLYTDSEFKTLAIAADDGSGTNSFNLKCRKFNVQDFRTILINLNTANNAAMTIKAQGTAKEESVNFNNAAADTNPWAYIQMIDLDNGDFIDGSTGVVLTGTDVHKQYEINTNALAWVCFEFSSVTAGTVQILATGYDNN